MDSEGKVLGHDFVLLDGSNGSSLDLFGVLGKVLVSVKLGTVLETTGPGKDGRNRVGRGLSSLLVDTVVAGDGTVGSLGLDGLAVRGDEHGSHQAERAVTLGDNVGLDITVVVLGCPDKATVRLERLSDHVVDETVLVPDTSGLVLGLELPEKGGGAWSASGHTSYVRSLGDRDNPLLVNLLENVLEATVVLLEDSVLGRQVKGLLLGESNLEARVGKADNRLLDIVHAHGDTGSLEVKDGVGLRRASVLGGKSHFKLARSVDDKVGGTVLVAESVTTNDDGPGPSRNDTGHVLEHDGLTEDGSAENVTDGAVGRLPHGLEVELCFDGIVSDR